MNSRSNILKAISENKPSHAALPQLPPVAAPAERLTRINRFTTMLGSIGGKVIVSPHLDVLFIDRAALVSDGKKVVSLVREAGEGNAIISARDTAIDLEDVDTAIIAASFGVAENGAVWVTESQCINRLLPFIAQHLVLILKAEDLFSDMHEAYSHIDVAAEGYGVFIAGPSKTADIEQSLVIGAHGARTATVYLLCDDQTILSQLNKS